jgi:protection-of-telomeres protein 1
LPNDTSYALPFVNARYHIKARVVDFYPPKLQDFAIQLLESEADDDKSEFSMDMTWNASTPKWEWSFALQVEEVATKTTTRSKVQQEGAPRPANRMWINVSHLEAQHLFGNAVDDPTDLREDAALLNQLREKLYILWGDLEEQKRGKVDGERAAKRAKLDNETADDQEPSNVPFNCCLQEYGALREGGRAEEITDWERQFMMFGVTIN